MINKLTNIQFIQILVVIPQSIHYQMLSIMNIKQTQCTACIRCNNGQSYRSQGAPWCENFGGAEFDGSWLV